MKLNLKKLRVSFNAPVTLGFCGMCLLAMILGVLTGNASNRLIFSTYGAGMADPLTYIRLIGHVFGHADWGHFFGNIMYIMILGPMLEEKHGKLDMILLIVGTALVTGILSDLLFPGVQLLGASGVVFAMILLSSFTRVEEGSIPLTFILVALLYIGQQIWQAATTTQNVAYLAHFAGGVVGAALGFMKNRRGRRKHPGDRRGF